MYVVGYVRTTYIHCHHLLSFSGSDGMMPWPFIVLSFMHCNEGIKYIIPCSLLDRGSIFHDRRLVPVHSSKSGGSTVDSQSYLFSRRTHIPRYPPPKRAAPWTASLQLWMSTSPQFDTGSCKPCCRASSWSVWSYPLASYFWAGIVLMWYFRWFGIAPRPIQHSA